MVVSYKVKGVALRGRAEAGELPVVAGLGAEESDRPLARPKKPERMRRDISETVERQGRERENGEGDI